MTADVHALAGAYALNALPDDERAFFERHLAACDACRLEVDELVQTAAQLGAAVAEPPPPDLRAKILAAADVTRQLPPAPPLIDQRAAATAQGRSRRWLAAVAACLAVALVAVTGVTVNLNRRLEDVHVAAADNEAIVGVLGAKDLETVVMDGTVAGKFLFSPSRNEGVLVAAGLKEPGEDETYELWLIHDGTPVPAGLFRPDADGAAVAAVDGTVRGAELVAVTIEPKGGSKRPTGSVLSSAQR